MKIIRGVLFAVLAGVFVLGSLVQLMGGGLARLADDLTAAWSNGDGDLPPVQSQGPAGAKCLPLLGGPQPPVPALCQHPQGLFCETRGRKIPPRDDSDDDGYPD